MIGDIAIPIRTTTRNKKPEISTADKLAHIHQKQAIRPIIDPEMGSVKFKLPYVFGLEVEFSDDESAMSIIQFNIGDKELAGHGIGSRLLRHAIEYGFENYERLQRLTHASANLALLNTVIKVVGEEYVSVCNRAERYGFGTARPLEDMFQTQPYREEYPYLVDSVEAALDRDAFRARTADI